MPSPSTSPATPSVTEAPATHPARCRAAGSSALATASTITVDTIQAMSNRWGFWAW